MRNDKDEAFDKELAGSTAGLNPMFGEWQNTFKFAPVPYGDGGAKRKEFQEAIQSQLKNKWLYSNELRLEITPHLDVQTVLETSALADLDNYAKSILDGLKGPDGIFFDDTQVQSLAISWLDSYGDAYFTVTAQSSPDDFVLKPVAFYEMPDGLWYPHGRFLWSTGKKLTSDAHFFVGLSILETMSAFRKRMRVEMRKAGADRLRAYQKSQYLASSARGFHRSRVEESGFQLFPRKKWQNDRQKWKNENPAELETFETELAKYRQAQESLTQALATKPETRARGADRRDTEA